MHILNNKMQLKSNELQSLKLIVIKCKRSLSSLSLSHSLPLALEQQIMQGLIISLRALLLIESINRGKHAPLVLLCNITHTQR